MTTAAEKGGFDGIIPGTAVESELLELLDDRDGLESLSGPIRESLLNRGLSICVIGQEGTGKSTLVMQLGRSLQAAGIEVRHEHVHRFWMNLSVSPWLLLHNRFIAKRVLIFDRTIYDNVAVHCGRRGMLAKVLRPVLPALAMLHPRFDVGFRLRCPIEQVLQRRRNTDRETFLAQEAIYDEVARRVGLRSLESTRPLLRSAMEAIAQALAR